MISQALAPAFPFSSITSDCGSLLWAGLAVRAWLPALPAYLLWLAVFWGPVASASFPLASPARSSTETRWPCTYGIKVLALRLWLVRWPFSQQSGCRCCLSGELFQRGVVEVLTIQNCCRAAPQSRRLSHCQLAGDLRTQLFAVFGKPCPFQLSLQCFVMFSIHRMTRFWLKPGVFPVFLLDDHPNVLLLAPRQP